MLADNTDLPGRGRRRPGAVRRPGHRRHGPRRRRDRGLDRAGPVRARRPHASPCWSARPERAAEAVAAIAPPPVRPARRGRLARGRPGARATWWSPRSPPRPRTPSWSPAAPGRRWSSRSLYDPWPTPLAAADAADRRAGRRARPAGAPGGAAVRAVHRRRRRRWRRCAPPASEALARRGDRRVSAVRRGRVAAAVACGARRAAGAGGWSPGCPEPARRSRAASPGRARRAARRRRAAEPPKEPTPTSPRGRASPGGARGCGRRRRWSALRLGWTWPLLCLLPLVPVGVALAVVDLRTRLLPDASWCCRRTPCVVVLAGAWSRAGRPATRDALVRAAGRAGRRAVGLLGCCGGSARPGMGFGDVRLAALLGFGAGLPRAGASWWSASTPASCSSGCPGLVLAVVRRDRALLRTAFPFGPFMLVGALVGVRRRRRRSGADLVGGGPARPQRTGRERLTAMLRWLTAGESHGPSLVAILEGLPAHVQVTTDDIAGRPGPAPARLRPRRPDEVRAGRGHASSAASGTARPWAARSRSRSATPSGPSGRR